ncbi:MAG: hypothetical protein AB1779_04195 [Candidatus Thermoplasmatota archaeon]
MNEQMVPSDKYGQQLPRNGVIKKSIIDISSLIAISMCICGMITYFIGMALIAQGIYAKDSSSSAKGIIDFVIAGVFFFASYPLVLYLYKRKEWWQKIEVK